MSGLGPRTGLSYKSTVTEEVATKARIHPSTAIHPLLSSLTHPIAHHRACVGDKEVLPYSKSAILCIGESYTIEHKTVVRKLAPIVSRGSIPNQIKFKSSPQPIPYFPQLLSCRNTTRLVYSRILAIPSIYIDHGRQGRRRWSL